MHCISTTANISNPNLHIQNTSIFSYSTDGYGEGKYGTYCISIVTLAIYLVSGVDSGPCLEDLPHHTGVAFERCNDQCSGPTLRDGG